MTAIITKLLSCINFVKHNFKRIAVIIIMILTAFCFWQNKKLKEVNNRLDMTQNNYEYYMNLSSGIEQQNKVLQLELNDFKETNDSIIKELQTVQKELKIKEKKLKQASTVKTEIVHDTTVIVKSNDFELEIKPNPLTSIIINKKDSLLTHKLNIENVQTLFVTQERVYRNKYKNWFVRLLHFDFKKKTQMDYQIHNSNDIINTKDTRLIEIIK